MEKQIQSVLEAQTQSVLRGIDEKFDEKFAEFLATVESKFEAAINKIFRQKMPVLPLPPPPPINLFGGSGGGDSSQSSESVIPAKKATDMSHLLDEIRRGTPLKKVSTNDRSASIVGGRVVGSFAVFILPF